MKINILSILILLTIFTSCQSDESRITKLFKLHMQEMLSDPTSYEFIKIETFVNHEKISTDSINEIYLNTLEPDEYYKKYQEIKDISGYYIGQNVKLGIVTYRAKNKFGMSILEEAGIRIDDKGEIHQIDNEIIFKIDDVYHYTTKEN